MSVTIGTLCRSLALKPGKPLAIGRIGAMAVLALPGNPVAALVASEHRECLLSGTLRKSRLSAIRAIVDPQLTSTHSVEAGNLLRWEFSGHWFRRSDA
jgi:molybdopterin biosynthesis enzyme